MSTGTTPSFPTPPPADSTVTPPPVESTVTPPPTYKGPPLIPVFGPSVGGPPEAPSYNTTVSPSIVLTSPAPTSPAPTSPNTTEPAGGGFPTINLNATTSASPTPPPPDDSAISINTTETTRPAIRENLYTTGGEYFTSSGTDYIGFYHIHPDKGPMVGANHIDSPHDYLYKVDSSQIPQTNIVNVTTNNPNFSSNGSGAVYGTSSAGTTGAAGTTRITGSNFIDSLRSGRGLSGKDRPLKNIASRVEGVDPSGDGTPKPLKFFIGNPPYEREVTEAEYQEFQSMSAEEAEAKYGSGSVSGNPNNPGSVSGSGSVSGNPNNPGNNAGGNAKKDCVKTARATFYSKFGPDRVPGREEERIIDPYTGKDLYRGRLGTLIGVGQDLEWVEDENTGVAGFINTDPDSLFSGSERGGTHKIEWDGRNWIYTDPNGDKYVGGDDENDPSSADFDYSPEFSGKTESGSYRPRLGGGLIEGVNTIKIEVDDPCAPPSDDPSSPYYPYGGRCYPCDPPELRPGQPGYGSESGTGNGSESGNGSGSESGYGSNPRMFDCSKANASWDYGAKVDNVYDKPGFDNIGISGPLFATVEIRQGNWEGTEPTDNSVAFTAYGEGGQAGRTDRGESNDVKITGSNSRGSGEEVRVEVNGEEYTGGFAEIPLGAKNVQSLITISEGRILSVSPPEAFRAGWRLFCVTIEIPEKNSNGEDYYNYGGEPIECCLLAYVTDTPSWVETPVTIYTPITPNPNNGSESGTGNGNGSESGTGNGHGGEGDNKIEGSGYDHEHSGANRPGGHHHHKHSHDDEEGWVKIDGGENKVDDAGKQKCSPNNPCPDGQICVDGFCEDKKDDDTTSEDPNRRGGGVPGTGGGPVTDGPVTDGPVTGGPTTDDPVTTPSPLNLICHDDNSNTENETDGANPSFPGGDPQDPQSVAEGLTEGADAESLVSLEIGEVVSVDPPKIQAGPNPGESITEYEVTIAIPDLYDNSFIENNPNAPYLLCNLYGKVDPEKKKKLVCYQRADEVAFDPEDPNIRLIGANPVFDRQKILALPQIDFTDVEGKFGRRSKIYNFPEAEPSRVFDVIVGTDVEPLLKVSDGKIIKVDPPKTEKPVGNPNPHTVFIEVPEGYVNAGEILECLVEIYTAIPDTGTTKPPPTGVIMDPCPEECIFPILPLPDPVPAVTPTPPPTRIVTTPGRTTLPQQFTIGSGLFNTPPVTTSTTTTTTTTTITPTTIDPCPPECDIPSFEGKK